MAVNNLMTKAICYSLNKPFVMDAFLVLNNLNRIDMQPYTINCQCVLSGRLLARTGSCTVFIHVQYI